MQSQNDTQQLERAFAAFTRHSQQLESAFEGLRGKVGMLNEQLAEANSSRLRELREKEALAVRLQQLLGALPGAVLVTDRTGCVAECNQRAVDLLGSPIIGVALSDVLARADRNSNDGELVLGDGTRLSVARRGLGARGAAGESIILLSDVTETRLIQSNLARKHRLVEMGEMAARLAHQIRTPLSSALLYSSQLRRARVDDAKRRAYAQRIGARLAQVERMVSDMLSFARGNHAVNEVVVVEELLGEVVALLEPQVRADDHLEVAVAPDAHHVRGNRDALTGALANLVCNALQASQPGVRVTLSARREDADTIALVVSDTGPGMTPEQVRNSFDAFFTTRPDGTGLGLAVVKSTAEAHGGTVHIDTAPGRGCTVAMHIDAPVDTNATAPSATEPDHACV